MDRMAGNDYYRGTGRYTRGFSMPEFDRERETVYFWSFAASTPRGWKSTAPAWRARRRYSTFRMEIGDVEQEKHTDRDGGQFRQRPGVSLRRQTLLSTAVFTGMNLIVVNRHHFALDYFGTPGLRITPQVEGTDAKVTVEAYKGQPGGTVKITL